MSAVTDTQTAQVDKRVADEQFERPEEDDVLTADSHEPFCYTLTTCQP